jgi:2,3-bisphosphoglycerate-dependent phosphoglycerate mutase
MDIKENQNFCTLYLVRHGQTEWNKKEILQGQADSPLTEVGKKQVGQAAQDLKAISFDAIFSSDLQRAQETAEILNLERQLAIQTSKLLRERDFGHYEGIMRLEYNTRLQHLIKDLSEQEKKTFKFDHDVESDEEVISRFITQLREIAVAYPNKTVLVVTHGGCIRTFLTHTGYVKYGELGPGSFSNAGYVEVACDGVDFFIKEVKGIKTHGA